MIISTYLPARLSPARLPLVDEVQPHHTTNGPERWSPTVQASDEKWPCTELAQIEEARRNRNLYLYTVHNVE
jgi:hypothetical protein